MRNYTSQQACTERKSLSHVETLVSTCLEKECMSAGVNNKFYIWVLVAALFLVDLKFAGMGGKKLNCSAHT